MLDKIISAAKDCSAVTGSFSVDALAEALCVTPDSAKKYISMLFWNGYVTKIPGVNLFIVNSGVHANA